MRTALTIALLRKGPQPFVVLAGPEVPIHQQISEFKKLAAYREGGKFSEMQLWVSDAGITKRLKFRDAKAEAQGRSAAEAAQQAEADRLAAQEKAKAEQLAREKADADAKEKAQLDADEKARLARAAAEAPAGTSTPAADATATLTGLAKFNADRRAAAAQKSQSTETK